MFIKDAFLTLVHNCHSSNKKIHKNNKKIHRNYKKSQQLKKDSPKIKIGQQQLFSTFAS